MVNDNTHFDLLVVGGGIFGLWVAKRAVEAGMSVALCEKGQIGDGASGGLLGALMPHIPTGWNDKKQFQLDALCELEAIAETLFEETGIATGYKRRGRIMPLRSQRFVDIAMQRERAGDRYWQTAGRDFSFHMDTSKRFESWLSPDYSPYGVVLDTLAASVIPRDYIKALRVWLSHRAVLMERTSFKRFHNEVAELKGQASSVKAKHVVLAHGYETFDHLRVEHGLDIGSGVKGQAASFKFEGDPDLPVIYDDGVYIVPHDNGTCAVGSTSEKQWAYPDQPDQQARNFIEKAWQMCPQLKGQEPVTLWAGVRPKSHEREPIVGKLFSDQEIFIATGGFKVSFGIAHRVAEALISEITGKAGRVQMPHTFHVDHHLNAYRSKAILSSKFLH